VVGSPLEPAKPKEALVKLDEDYELIYWTARLGCTSRALREAVRVVGPRVSDVVAWLRNNEWH